MDPKVVNHTGGRNYYHLRFLGCKDFGSDTDGVKAILRPSSLTFHPQRCFDLQGRRVQGQPRSGVYIRDGRKQVVK